jgi:alkanesulfonate monooxygenase SsuD/methylene tetrahydromethanopterin reductase-like flavin-dependent oxidoreductase (luciferase family)
VSLSFGLVLDFTDPTRPLDQQLARFRELIAVADRYGFHSITMGEGHGPTPGYGHTPAPFLVLAALAQTTRMLLGTGVTLLPGWHPVKLATDAAVLDQITGGRFILGVGLGPPDLARQFGVDPVRVGDFVDDTIAALRALWAGEKGFKGKLLNIEGGIGVASLQSGGPPIWVGGSVRRSVRRAAELGDGWVGSTSQSFDLVAQQSDGLRAALKAVGKDLSSAVVATNRLTAVSEDEAQARQLGERYVGEVLAFYARRGAQMPKEPGVASRTTADLFHEFDETRCLVGTPDQVIARAKRYEAAGVTHILARVVPHDIPMEHAVRTVELLGKHVLPAFQ